MELLFFHNPRPPESQYSIKTRSYKWYQSLGFKFWLIYCGVYLVKIVTLNMLYQSLNCFLLFVFGYNSIYIIYGQKFHTLFFHSLYNGFYVVSLYRTTVLLHLLITFVPARDVFVLWSNEKKKKKVNIGLILSK